MIEFLKNLFTTDCAAEKGAAQQKQRDVITLGAYAMSEDEEEQQSGGCCGGGGCGGCGCSGGCSCG